MRAVSKGPATRMFIGERYHLPLPDAPSSTMNSPRATSRLTLANAYTVRVAGAICFAQGAGPRPAAVRRRRRGTHALSPAASSSVSRSRAPSPSARSCYCAMNPPVPPHGAAGQRAVGA